MHHDRTTTSHPCWPALLVAALLGYAVRAAVERSLVRQLAAARAEAAHDPLTGLSNRRAAVSEVNTRSPQARSCSLCDLDDFKSVNDTFGHPTGDDLLAVVAARLYIAVPPDGFVARLAGDEFLILLPDHGGDPADAISPCSPCSPNPHGSARPRCGHAPPPAWPPRQAAPRAGGS